MKDLIIYHANCNDGVLAAAIVLKYSELIYKDMEIQPKIDLMPLNYNDIFATKQIINKNYTNIYIVDFSLPADTLVKLVNDSNVIVLDHHATAEAKLQSVIGKRFPRLHVIFNMEKSGAGLAWDHFFPASSRPEIVDIIEDRDLWKFKNPKTKAITTVIREQGMDPYTWIYFLDKDSNELMESMAKTGEIVLEHQESQTANKANKLVEVFNETQEITKRKFICINNTHLVSETLHAVLNHQDYKPNVAVSYFIPSHEGLSEDVEVIFSARSVDGKSAKELAESYNGGGHGNAAGFSLNIVDAINKNLI